MDRMTEMDIIRQLKSTFEVDDHKENQRTLYEKSVIEKQNIGRLVINKEYHEDGNNLDKLIKALFSKNVPECTANAKKLHLYTYRLKEKYSEAELAVLVKEADALATLILRSTDRLLFVNLQVDDFIVGLETRFKD